MLPGPEALAELPNCGIVVGRLSKDKTRADSAAAEAAEASQVAAADAAAASAAAEGRIAEVAAATHAAQVELHEYKVRRPGWFICQIKTPSQSLHHRT